MTEMSFNPARVFTAGILALVAAVAVASPSAAGPAREGLLASFAAAAQAADPAFTGFAAERGRTLFLATPGGGKPDTPSCTACHTKNPTAAGRTRAGKPIEALAVSVTPDRFTDPDKVAKWFRRNCKSVLGRECTAREKGDFITFMATQ
jgi:hypothetical protein